MAGYPMDILIIEDDGLVAASLQLVLEGQGTHTVRVATGCENAITSARAFPPDLILADVALTADRSDTSGLDAVAAIRMFAAPACIVMSGNARPEGVVQDVGDHFLRKPFQVADLLRLIQAASAILARS